MKDIDYGTVIEVFIAVLLVALFIVPLFCSDSENIDYEYVVADRYTYRGHCKVTFSVYEIDFDGKRNFRGIVERRYPDEAYFYISEGQFFDSLESVDNYLSSFYFADGVPCD